MFDFRRKQQIVFQNGCTILYSCQHMRVPVALHPFRCLIWCFSESRPVMSDSLRPYGLWPARLLCLWGSADKNTGVGSHSLLQGSFLTQGSSPSLPPYRQILYHLSHQGSPRTLEWVAYQEIGFPRGASQPRNRTGVSCIAGRFFTS